MSEKEYTVIANTREGLPALEAEITASSGAGPIPNRTVDIANPRLGSKIQTHFMLTDEEAEELRNDSRVRAVEIPADQRDDVELIRHGYTNKTFYRGSGLDPSYANWGLRRCMETTNTFTNSQILTGQYEFAMDGTGVDVVIQDSGIDADHPEWEDSSGTSRLQQINWYTASGVTGTQGSNFYRDYDGHGSHCAGIAAGKTHGWAKGARIYAQKLGGLEGTADPNSGISTTDAFDTIRLWHTAKAGARPTVVNMSWGYGTTITTDPTGGVYRGATWTYGVDYNNRNALWAATGVFPNAFNYNGTPGHRLPLRLASIDAEVDDMIADGIHVCIASGNSYYKIDVAAGDDYANTVTFNGTARPYHEGGSPYSLNAFMVGNIDDGVQGNSITAADQRSASSCSGPGVNIWAPGTSIVAATSSRNDGYTTIVYPPNEDYVITSIGGTSMASPQVAGVIAQHLQQFPNLTPAQMQARIWSDSKSVIHQTANNNSDYSDNLSIMGSTNRMLYTRYGKQAFTTNSVNIISNTTVG